MSGVLDRRAFLALTGAAVAAVAIAACGRGSSGPNVEIGALREVFPDRESVEQIGKYAVTAPDVGRRAPDVAAALAPNGSAAWLETASAPAIRDHLRAQVATDFAQDRIVNVAGWQLPLTEARVAALVYLSR